jgi:hypothetical protein
MNSNPRYPLAVLLLSAALPVFAAPTMHPGLWEVTTTMRMEGIPGIPAAQPMKGTECYTLPRHNL